MYLIGIGIITILSGCVDNEIVDNSVSSIGETVSPIMTIQKIQSTPVKYTSTPIQIEAIPDEINLEYAFGCIEYCTGDSGPSESNNGFSIISYGNSNLNDLKLVIDFYRASGDYYSTKSSDEVQIVEPNKQYNLYIKVPFQYIGTETWSYAKLYIIEDKNRYFLSDWKITSTQNNWGMNPLNGTFITKKY